MKRRRSFRCCLAVCTALIAPCQGLAQPAPAPASAAVPTAPPAADCIDPNPYDRDLPLTVPLTFGRRQLGELDIVLSRDDQLLIRSRSFVGLVSPLLAPPAQARLSAALGPTELFEAGKLAAEGVELVYDPASLAVLILRIDPRNRTPEAIFGAASSGPEEASVGPDRFSSYLNLFGAYTVDSDDRSDPALFLESATRFGSTVFEWEGVFERDSLGFAADDDGLEFKRRYARLVYDQPDRFRRFSLGDLDPEVRGLQGFERLGGVGVTRQIRTFDPGRLARRLTDRRFLLDDEATVRIFRNGQILREVRLDAGAYDIGDLPLDIGSNTVEVEILDRFGRTQRLSYAGYFDPIDLDPGEYEYSAQIGVTEGDDFLSGRSYEGGDLAFSGFYRRAFLDRPAIGAGAQLSARVQMVNAQTQILPPVGGRLQLEGALSNIEGGGGGYAVSATYQRIIQVLGQGDGVALQAIYQSDQFATLIDDEPRDESFATVGAQYVRVLNDRANLTANASHSKASRDFGGQTNLLLTLGYRLARDLQLQVSADYVDYSRSRSGFESALDDGFGLRVNLLGIIGRNARAEASYATRDAEGALGYIQPSSEQVGSFGYGARLVTRDDDVNLTGNAEYVGNRFTANAVHSLAGRSFSSVADDQVSSVGVGTALVFAGGAAALSRPVNNSFALVRPHPNLKGRRVIVGDALADGRPYARSGPLGGAVAGGLQPFFPQSVRYDVENLPEGYDIGAGVTRISPAFRSGTTVVVGTERFVSAFGAAKDAEGRPLALVGGSVSEAGSDVVIDFFTNSFGRFAVGGLRPGARYEVVTAGTPARRFSFTVPEDTTGLVRLGDVVFRPVSNPL